MSERRISEARGEFSDTINRVAYRGERVVLTRHGRRVAAVVPVEDLELLEALEDARDLDEVRAALADPANRERVTWEDLKARLNLYAWPVYRIEILASAARELTKLQAPIRRRIAARIDALAADRAQRAPRSYGAPTMSGASGSVTTACCTRSVTIV